jgi:hypothetical protein
MAMFFGVFGMMVAYVMAGVMTTEFLAIAVASMIVTGSTVMVVPSYPPSAWLPLAALMFRSLAVWITVRLHL